MTIDGKKFSGNSQYIKQGRVMHHGTLMFDSDLSVVANALTVSADKIESKGFKSVRSRITNIMEHMPQPLPISAFKQSLLDNMFDAQELEHYCLSEEDIKKIRSIQSEIYDRWDWKLRRVSRL
jgi:lipoate-protein ligase A